MIRIHRRTTRAFFFLEKDVGTNMEISENEADVENRLSLPEIVDSRTTSSSNLKKNFKKQKNKKILEEKEYEVLKKLG